MCVYIHNTIKNNVNIKNADIIKKTYTVAYNENTFLKNHQKTIYQKKFEEKPFVVQKI